MTAPAHPALATPRPRRLLVWRAGALGDTLTLFPALADLRRRYPGAVVDAVGTPSNLELAHLAGLVDGVWDAGAPLFSGLFVPLETGQEDRSGVLAAWLEGIDLAVVWSGAAPTIAGNLRHLGIPLVLAAAPFPAEGRGVGMAAYLGECLVPLGLGGAGPPVMPLLEPGEEARQATQSAWESAMAAAGGSGPPIVLHAGAGSGAKRWPLASFVALGALLGAAGWSVLWTRGPADGDVGQALLEAGIAPATILAGWSLPHLCALLARCAAVVASDSGIGHLSAALGLPTAMIFGPTDERVWAPLGPRVAVLRSAPCAWRGPAGGSLPAVATCPIRPCCLAALRPEEVARAVEGLCSSG